MWLISCFAASCAKRKDPKEPVAPVKSCHQVSLSSETISGSTHYGRACCARHAWFGLVERAILVHKLFHKRHLLFIRETVGILGRSVAQGDTMSRQSGLSVSLGPCGICRHLLGNCRMLEHDVWRWHAAA